MPTTPTVKEYAVRKAHFRPLPPIPPSAAWRTRAMHLYSMSARWTSGGLRKLQLSPEGLRALGAAFSLTPRIRSHRRATGAERRAGACRAQPFPSRAYSEAFLPAALHAGWHATLPEETSYQHRGGGILKRATLLRG